MYTNMHTCAAGTKIKDKNTCSAVEAPRVLPSGHSAPTPSHPPCKDSHSPYSIDSFLPNFLLSIKGITQNVDMLLYFSSFSQHHICKVYLSSHVLTQGRAKVGLQL